MEPGYIATCGSRFAGMGFTSQTLAPSAWSPKPEASSNPKSEALNPKPEALNRKPESHKTRSDFYDSWGTQGLDKANQVGSRGRPRPRVPAVTASPPSP